MSEKKNKTFVISDDSLNDYGCIVKTDGIDLKIFKENPVMLFNHDPNQVIGRWENIRVEKGLLLADAVFDTEDPEAAKIEAKVERGFIKAASGTIQAITLELGTEKEDAALILVESLIKEASIVPVPSNSNSLKLISSHGQPMTKELVLQLSSDLKSNISPMKEKLVLALATLLLVDQSEEAITEKVKLVMEENTQLKLAAKEHQTARVNDLVQSAIDQNKITAAEKDNILELATSNFDAAKKMLDARKPLISAASMIHNTPGKVEQDADERSKWDFDTWSKKDPSGLLQLKSNDRAKYNALVDGIRKDLASKRAIS